MSRLASLLVATALVVAAPRAQGSTLDNQPADRIQSLHRHGEDSFEAGEYSEARTAWTQAYREVPATPDRWPYRATLLSLIVNATLAEYSAGGDRGIVTEVATLLDEALEQPMEAEIQSVVAQERERLTPYIDPAPPEDETPPPAPAFRPSEAPQERRDTPPPRRVPNAVWIGGGAALTVGGIAAIIAGSRFRPRAVDMVNDAGDSTSAAPGKGFIDDESQKGAAWIAAGSTVAALGVAAIVVGVIRITRGKANPSLTSRTAFGWF